MKLQNLHLEWLNIDKIENLDIFSEVETCFLQYVKHIANSSQKLYIYHTEPYLKNRKPRQYD